MSLRPDHKSQIDPIADGCAKILEIVPGLATDPPTAYFRKLQARFDIE